MDSEETSTSRTSLGAPTVIPIANLSPDLPDASTKSVRGVVTITWPYNSVNRTFAFNLAEPDFRLRRNKGQVRVNFTGRIAKAVGSCRLGSNDEVLLSLDGSAWEGEETSRRQSLPGMALGWKLIYTKKLFLKITRAETGDNEVIALDEDFPNETGTTYEVVASQPAAAVSTPSPPLSPVQTKSPDQESNLTRLQDGEFASPAFLKRARMSYGSLFEGDFDIFEDDGGVRGKGRKRTRFGRDSGAWRYASQSPSPEPVASSPSSADGYVGPPARVETTDDGIQTTKLGHSLLSDPAPLFARPVGLSPSSPVAADTADEGCHTTVPAQPSSWLTDVPVESLSNTLPSKSTPVSNSPAEELPSSVADPETQAKPSGSWSAATKTDEPTATTSFNDTLHRDVATSPLAAYQQAGFREYNSEVGSLSAGLVPSASASQEHEESVPPLISGMGASSGLRYQDAYTQSTHLSESDDISTAQRSNAEDIRRKEPTSNNGHYDVDHSLITHYPTVDIREETHSQHDHDEALINYPASYLEETSISHHSQMIQPIIEHQATRDLGTSSWATINRLSPMDRLDGKDGNTPEQALVIDESESGDDDDSPAPMPVEDIVENGRAYPLDMYEDAQVEDETDAEYSDEDEPEYDADEMGDDYDTRNYEEPADDEDDSHDEDLRPHALEPEFDDGESWDDDERDEMLDEEDEESASEREPTSQPVVRSNPPVIDLISSSEDEGEDEDEGENKVNNEGNNNITGDQQPAVPIDQPRRALGPRHDIEMDNVMEDRTEEKDGELDQYEEGREREEEGDGEDEAEDEEDKQGHHGNDSEFPQSSNASGRVDVLQEDNLAAMPLSAADGLEILSRVVDNESATNGGNILSEIILGEGVIETISQSQSTKRVDAQFNEPTVEEQKKSSEASHESLVLKQDDGNDIISAALAATDVLYTLDTSELPSKPPVSVMQLPIPADTQVTSTNVEIDMDRPLGTGTDFEAERVTAEEVSVDESLQQEIRTYMERRDAQQQIGASTDMHHIASSRPNSPAFSFQSQVDDVESVRYDSEQEASDGNNALFLSHMEVDEELQASILENSQLDGAFSDDFLDAREDAIQDDSTKQRGETCDSSKRTEDPKQGRDTPRAASASSPTRVSAQLLRDFAEAGSVAEYSDTATQDDPSVHLARAANASKRAATSRASSTDPRGFRMIRTFDARRSWTPETEDSSVLLARASFGSQPPTEEDSYSMTSAKLQLVRHLRDELTDFTSLMVLRQHLTKPLDVIAVATMQPPEPRRAKGGPREYMMSFTISDHSIGPYAVAEVLIYRPHRDTLPVIRFGDVVLLRNFTPVSLTNKGFGLRTNDASSWAVFDREDEPAQINGPPVEYGEKEMLYVSYLREWFGLLDVKARARLERANQKIIDAGKSKSKSKSK